MERKSELHLSRRERQIMDVIYHRGRASAMEVMNNIPDPPSYSAVRALLRILERKGYVKHISVSGRYIYSPTQSRRTASRSAIRRVLRTFFHGSVELAVAALLDVSDRELSPEELDRLTKLIAQAKKTRSPVR